MRRLMLTVALAAASAAPAAASVTFLAKGSITGSSAGAGLDLSGLTGTLENGLPEAILGGLGSGLTYVGGNTFLSVPDRGPNATVYDPAIDNTVSYISRFQTLTLSLDQSASGSALPFTLSTSLDQTTLLSSSTPLVYGSGQGLGVGSGVPAQNGNGRYYFTGRSDNYGSGGSGNLADARFDPESVRVSNDGKTVYISDEYGPYVRAFDRTTGQQVAAYKLPDNLNAANLAPTGDAEIAGNTTGRVANKGMEGLAITPDGKTLVGIMQAPLEQDAADPATSKMVRIVTIDAATGTTHEYGYALTTGSGVSDIVAINDHEFLVDERDGKGLGDGSKAKVKQIFKVDLAGATDITGLNGAAAAAAVATKSGTPFLDLVDALKAAGFSADQIPAKIEGITFGQDVVLNGETLHTLYIANDNDFLPDEAGANQFFVFGFKDGDLPGYQPQQLGAVPEPASWAMMVGGFAFMGTLLRRRRPLPRPA